MTTEKAGIGAWIRDPAWEADQTRKRERISGTVEFLGTRPPGATDFEWTFAVLAGSRRQYDDPHDLLAPAGVAVGDRVEFEFVTIGGKRAIVAVRRVSSRADGATGDGA